MLESKLADALNLIGAADNFGYLRAAALLQAV
jgi:hypothetical protein